MGRLKKSKAILKKNSPQQKQENKRGRKKKHKEPKVKVSDIKIDFRTYDDMVKLGYYSKKANKYDMSWEKVPFFKKIPIELVVNELTPVGTKLWSARNIAQGHRKEIFFLHKHILANNSNPSMIEVTDAENIKKIFLYEQVCIIPSHHKASQQKTLETVLEEVKEIKKQAKASRKKKEK